MNEKKLLELSIALATTLFGAIASAQNNPLSINRIDWSGPVGTGSLWNLGDAGQGKGTNWAGGNQPDRDFQEYASISNGGIASINSAISADPADVILAEDAASTGMLVIGDGGAISIEGDDPGGNGNGRLVNGAAGSGVLTLHDAIGAVEVEGYSQGPTSTLTVEIDGTSFNPVSVSREIEIDGTLEINGTLAGATSSSTWTLFDGSGDSAIVNGQFDQIVNNSSFTLGEGQDFVVSTTGSLVTLGIQQRLLLRVDPYAGTAVLSNPASSGSNIDLTGYVLSVASGTVDTREWVSFRDDGDLNFVEGASTTQLGETNATSAASLAAGTNKSLGAPLALDVSQPIGTDLLDDISFQYSTPENAIVDALIVLDGNRQNNLVLVVDPSDGSAVLQNQSSEAVDLTGYVISSSSGALLPGWSSLESSAVPGWDVVTATSSALAELNPENSSSLAVGASLDLGVVWDQSTMDLSLDFSLSSAVTLAGAVFYGEPADISVGLQGDFNGDGQVNLADYTVWRDNLGATEDGSVLSGNGNGGIVDSFDYDLWKANFGMQQPSAASIGAATIPEPVSVIPLALACGFASCLPRKLVVAQRNGRDARARQ